MAKPLSAKAVRTLPHVSLLNALLLFVLILSATTPAQLRAKQMALLVGVSEYPSQPTHKHLRGPKNDVPLMANVLTALGVDDIAVLADGVPDADLPTRARIIDELDRLARVADVGDQVVLFFSGHGARQPAKPEDIGVRSLDGFDAIFLPRDIGKWDGSMQRVKNAIVNFEVKDRLEAIRAKGAFVWAIFDTCHSAYMTRAVETEGPDLVRYRFLSDEDLGIPHEVVSAAEARGERTRGITETEPPLTLDQVAGPSGRWGDYVTSFAAGANEKTPEYRQADNQDHGLFTYNLVEALKRSAGATFEQLGQFVSQQYRGKGRQTPNPVFAGSALNRSWSGKTAGLRQWTLALEADGKVTMPAGTLYGVGQGTVLSVLPSAVDGDEKSIGTVVVKEASAVRSTVEVPRDAERPINRRDLNGKTARIKTIVVPFVLTVAKPLYPSAPEADVAVVQSALAAIEGSEVGASRIGFEDPGTPSADIRLELRDGRLWFVQGDQPLVTEGYGASPSLPLEGESEESLGKEVFRILDGISKVLNLARIERSLPDTGKQLGGIEVDLGLKRMGDDAFEPLTRLPIDVGEEDRLQIRFRNQGRRPVDLSVLYVDSHFGIKPLFPESGELNRFYPSGPAGSTSEWRDVVVARTVRRDGSPGTLGNEQIVLIAVEAEPHQDLSDFSFLAQEELHRTRGELTPTADLFAQAGFARTQVRGGELDSAVGQALWMKALPWRVGVGTGEAVMRSVETPRNAEPEGPAAIDTLSNGQILVLDPPALAIRVFDGDGTLSRELHLYDIVQPVDMVAFGEFIYVLDAGASRVAKLNLEGELVDSLPIDPGIDALHASLSVPRADDVRLRFSDGSEVLVVGERSIEEGDSPGGASLASPRGPVWWRFERSGENRATLRIARQGPAGEALSLAIESGDVLSAAELVHVDRAGRLYVLAEELLEDHPAFDLRMTVLRFAPDGQFLDEAEVPLQGARYLPSRFLTFGADGRTKFLKPGRKRTETITLLYERSRGVGAPPPAEETPSEDPEDVEFEAYVRAHSPTMRGSGEPLDRYTMEQRALDFLDERFVLTESAYGVDVVSECDPDSKQFWERPRRFNGKLGTEVTRVPYKWGGCIDLDTIRDDLHSGKLAGDVCTCRSGKDCVYDQATGVDCSGFVSQVWGIPYHTTSSLHKISSTPDSWRQLKLGDILNKAGSHVRMFRCLDTSGFYRVNTIESSATGCGGVCAVAYRLGKLLGYRALRYKKVIESADHRNAEMGSGVVGADLHRCVSEGIAR